MNTAMDYQAAQADRLADVTDTLQALTGAGSVLFAIAVGLVIVARMLKTR